MSHNLLALASQANEAAIEYREAVDDVDVRWSPSAREHRDQASRALLEAVDALTGAVVEAANEAPIVLRRKNLTRLSRHGYGGLFEGASPYGEA